MIVCVCTNISDSKIQNKINPQYSLNENRKFICKKLNVGRCCGKCIPCLTTLIEENLNKKL